MSRRPGLLTVERSGKRTFYPVGFEGLTDSIVFNERKAFDWVKEQRMFPEGTRYTDYVNFICGLPCEECPEQSEEVDYETPTDEPTDITSSLGN